MSARPMLNEAYLATEQSSLRSRLPDAFSVYKTERKGSENPGDAVIRESLIYTIYLASNKQLLIGSSILDQRLSTHLYLESNVLPDHKR